MVTEYIAELPAGYDERTRLALNDHNQVIATHPELPSLILSWTGQWLDDRQAPVHPAHSSSTS